MTLTEKIAKQIEGLNIKDKTVGEIASKLGFARPFEIDKLRDVCKYLEGEGKLVCNASNRYSSSLAKGLEKADKRQSGTLVRNGGGVSNKENPKKDAFARQEKPKAKEGEKLIKGILRGNKKGFAFLIREDKGEDIFIPNRRLCGAMHGDTVTAKIIKGDEGEVVSIVMRGVKELVGTYYKEKVYGFVVPDDSSYFSDLFIPPKKSDGIPNKTKVVAKIISYIKGKNPEAEIVEVIGKVGEKRSDVLSILKSYGFFNEFSPASIAEINTIKNLPVGAGRSDLRGLLTITIDGDDSKDFDDAISLKKEGENYRLWVHIADVSHFVREGSCLDDEALKRATSVYFPGSVYPMLPAELSNDICSLNPGEDRLALTVEISLNHKGDVVASKIFESVIRSDYRMTYHNVTEILEGNETLRKEYSRIAELLCDMNALSALLDKKREVRGAINFETRECKILLDKEGNVDKIVPYDYTISNNIIEQFMVLANEVVAETYCKAEIPFVYRIHEKPDGEKLETFKEFAKGCGVDCSLKEVSPKEMQTILKSVEGTSIEGILSKVMLRSMQKAKYSPNCLGHFGLSLKYYSHFTSPIRRYPDLMIHRIIKEHIGEGIKNLPKLANRVDEISAISSEREKASEMAERDIDDYYKAEYMLRHLGEEFVGIVSGVTSFGVFVELDNTCEGLARLNDLPADRYTFNEKRFNLVGTKHQYTLGQKVKIKVLASSVEEKRVSFAVLEEENGGN